MIRLSVNVNKVATLRNARGGDRPQVTRAAGIAIGAGCHGITVHPRPDERHIRFSDVRDLAALLRGTATEFNVEGYPSAAWIALVREVAPAQATLVPDPPETLTSNAGWRFGEVDRAWLRGVVDELRAAGCRVSLFVDPDERAVDGAREAGADRIELFTEAYARAFATPRQEAVFDTYRSAARRAGEIGLAVNAGHDLDLQNLGYLAANLPGLQEVSIGHALICDALEIGLEAAVRSYLELLVEAA